jgi:hypothetical protein
MDGSSSVCTKRLITGSDLLLGSFLSVSTLAVDNIETWNIDGNRDTHNDWKRNICIL